MGFMTLYAMILITAKNNRALQKPGPGQGANGCGYSVRLELFSNKKVIY